MGDDTAALRGSKRVRVWNDTSTPRRHVTQLFSSSVINRVSWQWMVMIDGEMYKAGWYLCDIGNLSP